MLIFFSFCYFFFSLLISKEFVHKKEWGELYVVQAGNLNDVLRL